MDEGRRNIRRLVREAGFIILLFVLGYWQYGWAYDALKQRTNVPSHQQTDSSLETKAKPDQPKNSTNDLTSAVPETSTGNHSKEADDQAQAANQASEYTTIFHHRLKITDFALCAFTLGLVAIGAWQGVQFKRTVDATREIASAAIGVELPQLHVLDVQGGQTIIEQTHYAVSARRPRISVTVKNYGRTPAFVTNYIVNAVIADELPNVPAYRLFTQELREMVITPDDSRSLEERAYHAPNIFNEDEIFGVVSEDDFLWVYGKILFNDFMGNGHEKGFSYRWNFKAKRFNVDHTPAYNYQHKAVGEPSWKRLCHKALQRLGRGVLAT